LDDQKEYIHDSVALYMESRQGTSGCSGTVNGGALCTSLLMEEAFHLERAKSWMSAMDAYYRSALQMELFNSPKECARNLLSALAMLEHMRECAGITGPKFCVQDVYADFGIIAHDADLPSGSGEEIYGAAVQYEQDSCKTDYNSRIDLHTHAVNSIKDVYAMFEGDADALERAIRLLLKLGHLHIKLTKSTTKIRSTKIFCEALQFILLTNTAEILQLRQSHTNNKDKLVNGDLFGVKDVSVFFSILISLHQLFHLNKLVDDEQRSIAKSICDSFTVLATSNARYAALKVVSNCLWRNFFLDTGQLQMSFNHAEKIMFTYKFSAHSKTVLKLFPFDFTVQTLVMDLQLKIMLGMFNDVSEYMSYFEEILPTMKHLITLGRL
jgi:hypothetical protein